MVHSMQGNAALSVSFGCRMQSTTVLATDVYLEQEHVLSAVRAMDGEPAWALLAGDHCQLRRKGGDRYDGCASNVCPWYRQLQTLQISWLLMFFIGPK